MDGTKNHFPAQNALDCRILHIQPQNFPPGVISPVPRRRAPLCLDPDTNFHLVCQRHNTTTALNKNMKQRKKDNTSVARKFGLNDLTEAGDIPF